MSSVNTIIRNESETSQYATFYIGELLLGIRIDRVQEINRHLEITHVPHANPAIRGVINLRGEVVSVVDLPRVLGLGTAEVSENSRNLIIQHDGELISLMVDRVADILSIEHESILPPPVNVKGVDSRFFKGVHTTENEIVVILEIDELLSN
ncbi:MAG: chemotaxis protein CheW [Pirellulaceae bacterium]